MSRIIEFLGRNYVMNWWYRDFLKCSRQAFTVPGLKKGLIPQGIAYRKDKKQFYITAYAADKKKNSVILVIDGDSGKHTGEYSLYKRNGEKHTGHVGGIAVTEKDIYITSGHFLERISLKAVDDLGKQGKLKIEEEINISLSDASISFCGYDAKNKMLLAGNFYYGKKKAYSKKAFQNYNTLIMGYEYQESTGDYFNNKTGLKYLPDVVYYTTEDKIQGATVTDSGIWLSKSYGRYHDSKLILCNCPVAEDKKRQCLRINSSYQVPIFYLDEKTTRKIRTMPMSEGLTVAGDKLYILYESGAEKYKNGIHRTEYVWELD